MPQNDKLKSTERKFQRVLPRFLGFAIAGSIAVGLAAAGLSQEGVPLLGMLAPSPLSPDSTGQFVQKSLGLVRNTRVVHSSSSSSLPRSYCIAALGRLEPQGEVVRLTPPAFIKDERVGSVYVKAGQLVCKGDAIAVMDNQQRLSVALDESEQRVIVCRTQLKQVLAGAKHGEIQAQAATVKRLRAELAGQVAQMQSQGDRLKFEEQLAATDFSRYQKLYTQGAVSTAEFDMRRTKMDTSRARLAEASAERKRVEETTSDAINEAQATLDKISEVRPVDVAVAQAELESAIASASRIKTDLELATIRAPQTGRILKVWAHAGESVGEKGIADMGQTGTMVAVAEVFEFDLRFVKKGQHVSLKSPAFDGELAGTVSEVGWRVSKQNVFASDPGANFDDRVVEVKAALTPESSRAVESLTNMQVEVKFAG